MHVTRRACFVCGLLRKHPGDSEQDFSVSTQQAPFRDLQSPTPRSSPPTGPPSGRGGDTPFREASSVPADCAGALLIDVMSKRQKRRFSFLVAAWAAGLIVFCCWWFRAGHMTGALRFGLNSFLLVSTLSLPAYFFFFVSRMKRVDPSIPVPGGWRVAMVTTRAPSEPFSVVQATLEAMLAQDSPHDTWLADEDPTEEIYRWCAEHGVRVSSRKGVPGYHQPAWPRRARCKEGNLAYFYDTYGYEWYDFVVQMDADHEPGEGYLEAMLRPFVDSSVGYVSAPSVCDKNAGSSWSARGRLFAESIMHGPLQAGYNSGFAPLCIGSHYAVRTAALREIGGLGPELAEDHSTTLMMNAHGWRGVHALDAVAHGEGPPTLAECITQEFQWSRSLMVILLTLLPKYWRALSWRLRLQFLFSELWYPWFGGMMLLGTAIPVIAVMSAAPWARVSYPDFLLHTVPVVALTVAILAFLRNHAWLRPTRVPLFSWEVGLFQVIRWPWVVYGSCMGILAAIGRRQMPFRVTPKGVRPPVSLSWKVLTPYLAVVVLSFLPPVLVENPGDARGYCLFLILSQLIYLTALFSIVLIHCHENSAND